MSSIELNTKPQPGNKHEAEDSAPAPRPGKGQPPEGNTPKEKGGKNNSAPRQQGKQSNTPRSGPSPKSGNSPPRGFPEGNKVLETYGLSVSGRKERILSAIKTDKYFQFVEDAWNQLVDAKPHITERFSYAEFRHASALQLYQRIEHVKFEALGIKPGANVRIPLPRNLRVFQPIWSVLANIGRVDDDDLRVVYVPDAVLPKSEDLSDPDDVTNLLTCTLYDWSSSWHAVEKARSSREKYDSRIGYDPVVETNEYSKLTTQQLIARISQVRKDLAATRDCEASGSYKIIDGFLYKIPSKPKDHEGDWEPTDDEIKKGKKFQTSSHYETSLSELVTAARAKKEEMIRPRLDISWEISTYRLADGEITADAGAYGRWLHWDPRLWIEYEQIVEILSGICMFSLSMPVEVEGTYMWLIPVESRERSSDVFCKLPKASIPPVTWIMSLLLQMSTLPIEARSTWYTETDRLSNVVGLRVRYIRSAIKRAAPTEQYGTY